MHELIEDALNYGRASVASIPDWHDRQEAFQAFCLGVCEALDRMGKEGNPFNRQLREAGEAAMREAVAKE